MLPQTPRARPSLCARRCAGRAIAWLALVAGCRRAAGAAAELRGALDAAYPRGWRFATLPEYARSEMRAGDDPGWIRGDFDGDGQADYAAQVVAPRRAQSGGGRDSAQIVVALLRRGATFEPHELSVGGGPNAGVFLTSIPRGEVVQDFEQRDAPITLRADAVHQIFAGQASVAYVYDRGRWIEVFTSD